MLFSCKIKKYNLGSNIYYIKDYMDLNERNLTLPINNILENLPVTGGTIIFPKGNFIISEISLIGNKDNKYGQLSFIGSGTNIKLKKNSKSNPILLENIKTVKVENIKIDGNKNFQKNNKVSGLNIRNCDNVELTNISIENCSQSGVKLNAINNLLIQDSNFSKNGVNKKGVYSDGITAVNIIEGKIINNTCNYNNSKKTMDGDGIQIGNTENKLLLNNLQKISIIGNTCIGNGRRGIKIQRSIVHVEKNIIYENKAKQIAIVQEYPLNDISVTNNTIGRQGINSMQSIVIHSGQATEVFHENILITNNTFQGSFNNEGVLLDNCKNIVFKDNALQFDEDKSSTPQIRITDRCQNSKIQKIPGKVIVNKGKNIQIQ